MRTSLQVFVILALLAVALAAHAQPAPEQVDLHLDAQGGATLKVPATWKEVRKDPKLVVREQAPDPATKTPFYVLLASIEEGPPVGAPDSQAPGVPWLKVRDNIQEAASKNGRKVRLDVGDAYKGLQGFEGRRFHGELEGPVAAGAPEGTPPRKVAITLIALVKDAKLLTIGLVSEPASAEAARDLVATIAQSARLGP
ncbi:MAG: hypothetical protein U1F43_14570 [Myxococcota bacterium]